VVAAAVVHPVIMAVGASISVLTTGYLLNPDTGLGRLGLLLSVLFTAMMWTVLKPYRRLTSLVTGNPADTPRQALNRLKTRATELARATGLDHAWQTITDPTKIHPPHPPDTVITRSTRPDPDDTPTWAREDHHEEGGGNAWLPTDQLAGLDPDHVPTWAKEDHPHPPVWLPTNLRDLPTSAKTPRLPYHPGGVREVNLPEHLMQEHQRQVRTYGKVGFVVLENGRIRYTGGLKPAATPGIMRGLRKVREWDPKTGAKRTWFEAIDWNDRVRSVRVQEGGPKVHHIFDEFGNYEGSR
jgi:hypothetical protein